MSTYRTRLGATLELDGLKEKDIIDNVEHLKSKHKLSAYTTALYRVAHNNPDVEALVRQQMGELPNTRDKFFDEIKGEIQSMNSAIMQLRDNIAEQKATLLYWDSICPMQKLENTALGLLSIQNHLKEIKRTFYGDMEFPEDTLSYMTDIQDIADSVLVNVMDQLKQLNITGKQLISSVPQQSVYTPQEEQTVAPPVLEPEIKEQPKEEQEVTAREQVAPPMTMIIRTQEVAPVPMPVTPMHSVMAISEGNGDTEPDDGFFDDLDAFCGTSGVTEP